MGVKPHTFFFLLTKDSFIKDYDFIINMGVLDNLFGNVDIGSAISKSSNFFYGFIIFILVSFIVGIATWWWANRKAYNKKIQVYHSVAGNTMKLGTDFAREVVLPHTSVRAFYLKKNGFYLPRPTIAIDKNEYIYFVRSDGEWFNSGLGNLDVDNKKINLSPDLTDMRMANASLKRLVEKNYKKMNWFKEYAPYLGFGLLIFLLGIVSFLILREAGQISGALTGTLDAQTEITNKVSEMISSMDNICSGSGIRRVG